MEELSLFEEILSITPGIVAAISVAILGVLCTISKVKSLIAKIKNGETVDLTEFISDLIVTAESFVNFSGVQKLDYVMNKLEIYVMKNDLEITSEELSAKVESLIDLTNQVNVEDTPVVESTDKSNFY